ncbi:MAG: PAS domain S-box protein [Anaerolineae bacterium]
MNTDQNKTQNLNEASALYAALHDISIELTSVDDMDTLYRTIIELGLSRLPFDRLGLFMFDQEQNIILGTYGTDVEGHLQNEAHIKFTPRPDGRFTQSLQDPGRYFHDENMPLLHNLEIVGYGEVVSTAFRYKSRVLGWLSADNLINKRSFTEPQLEIFAQYGVLIAATIARQQAEEARRKSEQMLQNVLDTIPTRVFWKDRNFKLVGCNQKVVEDSGFASATDLIGKSDEDWLEDQNNLVVWRGQAAKYLADDRHVIETGKPLLNYEETQVRSDGKTYWLRTSKLPLKDENGETVGLLGIYDDITERKNAEIALKQSEELFSKVFYSAPIGISIGKLQNGEYVDVNPKWSEMFGYSREEARGYSGKDLGLWGDEALLTPILAEVRDKGNLAPREIEFRRRDGTPIWVDYSVQIIDINGERHFVAMISDSTARKNAEVALQRSEERLRQAVRASNMGIFEHDHLTDQIYFSPEYRTIYGWRQDEVVTTEKLMKFQFTAPEDRERHRLAIEKAYDPSGDGLMTMERRILDVHGKERWVITRSRTFFEGEAADRHKVRTVGAALDITERKKTELALEAKRHDEMIFQEYLKLLHKATVHLTLTDTLDDFYKETVRIGLEWFKFDRMGLWLLEGGGNVAKGTYGTDESGNIQSEHHFSFDVKENQGMGQVLKRPEHFYYEEVGDLEHNLKVVGKGWKVTVALWLGDQNLGWLSVDNLIRGKPITKPELDILGQYGMFVAALLGRKQTAYALRISEERLRQAIRISKIGIFEVDEEANEAYYSPEHREIYGWSTNEVITLEKLYERVHPKDRERWIGNITRARDPRSDGIIIDTEYQVTDVHGVTHWLTANTRTYFEGVGEARHAVRTVGAIQDITSRKHMEFALLESEARYRAIINSQIDLISRFTPDTKITFANSAYCEFFDRSLDQLVGQSFLELVAPDFRELAQKETTTIAHDPSLILTTENRVSRRDGSERWIQWVSQAVNAESGQALELQSVGRDITELKIAQKALERYNKHLSILRDIDRAILGADTPIAVTELVFSRLIQIIPCEWTRIVVFNEALNRQQTYVYTPSRETKVEVLPPLSVELGEAVAYLKSGSRTSDLKALDGIQAKVVENLVSQGLRSAMSIPLMIKGKLLGVLALASAQVGLFTAEQQEICETVAVQVAIALHQSELRAQIIQQNNELERRVEERTRELQRANDEVKNFAYIVSHDLRAPLVNLKGFASELRSALTVVETECSQVFETMGTESRKALEQVMKDDIPEALRFIETSVSQMDSFTKAILKLSRLGRSEFEFVPVDVRLLVERILAAHAYEIERQGVEVELGELPIIVADHMAMEQIFGNILTNALTYLSPERTGKIEIRSEVGDDEILFQIRDNGRGIAKADMDKVFAPFRRAGKQDKPGEGMGLAYVQMLVQRHGGRIWCDSQLNSGTVFTFSISSAL